MFSSSSLILPKDLVTKYLGSPNVFQIHISALCAAPPLVCLEGFCCCFLNLFIFRERGREGERGRETSMFERNIYWLPLACPTLGTWPATQACSLTGNWTSNLSVCRPALSPLSHTSQCCLAVFSSLQASAQILPSYKISNPKLLPQRKISTLLHVFIAT